MGEAGSSVQNVIYSCKKFTKGISVYSLLLWPVDIASFSYPPHGPLKLVCGFLKLGAIFSHMEICKVSQMLITTTKVDYNMFIRDSQEIRTEETMYTGTFRISIPRKLLYKFGPFMHSMQKFTLYMYSGKMTLGIERL